MFDPFELINFILRFFIRPKKRAYPVAGQPKRKYKR